MRLIQQKQCHSVPSSFNHLAEYYTYHFKLFTDNDSLCAQVVFSEIGATVFSLETWDRTQKLEDILVGYTDHADYLRQDCYFGTTIGRHANRIARGEFALAEKQYQLAINNAPNNLHGGPWGFNCQRFDATLVKEDDSLVGINFRYISPDGDQGFPGEVIVDITYRFQMLDESTGSWRLAIQHTAKVSEPTLVNLTNHAYFNLHPQNQDALEHLLVINADHYTPIDENLIPTGEIAEATGLFSFRKLASVGSHLDLRNPQQKIANGLDHNFVLRSACADLTESAAVLYSPHSGRKLTLSCTQPGLQLYTANYPASGKDKFERSFVKHDSICLEPQYFPNSINQAGFIKPITTPEKPYFQVINWDFTVV